MRYPSNLDFLEVFGLDAVDVDESRACSYYRKFSDDGALCLDFSFSEIEHSFQVVLYHRDVAVMQVVSENVRSVALQCDKLSRSIHVVFGLDGAMSEATVTLEPAIHCDWWTLRR